MPRSHWFCLLAVAACADQTYPLPPPPVQVITHTMMETQYGLVSDPDLNQYEALSTLFADLDAGLFGATPLGSDAVVLDFGDNRHYCGLFEPSPVSTALMRTTGGCGYADTAGDYAPLSLHRDGVTIRLGSGTVLDIDLHVAGRLAADDPFAIYYKTDWLPEGTDDILNTLAVNDYAAVLTGTQPGPDDPVLIEFSRTNDGHQDRNQIGVTVTELVQPVIDHGGARMRFSLAQGLRFDVRRPQFSVINAFRDDQLPAARGEDTLLLGPGAADFASTLAPGDLIRIDNRFGNDSVHGHVVAEFGAHKSIHARDNAYFEFNRVLSIQTTPAGIALRLQHPLAYDYDGILLMRPDHVSDFSVVGSALQPSRLTRLQLDYVQDVHVEGLQMNAVSAFGMVDFTFDGLDVDAELRHPIALRCTYCRNGEMEQLSGRGTISQRDNAAIKLMSPIGVRVVDIEADDTTTTNPVETNLPFFVDYYFTPYASYAQDLNISGIVTGQPQGTTNTRSVWFAGVRDSTVDDVSSIGGMHLDYVSRMRVGNVEVDASITAAYDDRMMLHDFQAPNLYLSNSNTVLMRRGRLWSAVNAHNRCLWLNRVDRVTVDGVHFVSGASVCDGVSVYLQDSTNIRMRRLSDRARALGVGFSTSPSILYKSYDPSLTTESALQGAASIRLTNHTLQFGHLIVP